MTSRGDAIAIDQSLTAKEKAIHEQGLVSVLRQLHDELDRVVFDAYGWGDLAKQLVNKPGATTPWPEKPDDQTEAEKELLQRLVALNHERAFDEERGLIRWLRIPEPSRRHGHSRRGKTQHSHRYPNQQGQNPMAKNPTRTGANPTRRPRPISQKTHYPQQLAKTFKSARKSWELDKPPLGSFYNVFGKPSNKAINFCAF
uniref:Uncharacterized protein n=1 Tax=Candidatus Kentrum sp. MB TaxID=2138164 RepID=A0A450XJP0_9GAMM|nr:MAG: hypothetical protein BECKMB1821G_GA0114241_104432 [Candidatus Kentron sp. MB]VFK29522.1 MAG: hypothetical protein BECKMB1821I_GA0114274_101042 [Candidatus Kentron sp. MB]VFK74815.1 MAG: hypothetical protein BECKMB1821H_GA0114242_101042 [Candidatus Kentron sp. MB]